MTQYSTAYIFAADTVPTPIPDFTVTLHLTTTATPQTFGVQLNALTYKYWPQFCIEPLIGANGGFGGDMGWAVSVGTAGVASNWSFPGFPSTSYLVEPTGEPWVMFADTAKSDSTFFAGTENIMITQKNGVITMALTDIEGNVLASDSWNALEPLYMIGIEVVGTGSGNGTTFTQFDGTLTYHFDSPVQIHMANTMNTTPTYPATMTLIEGSEIPWGTWSDPNLYNGNTFPLYWLDETGEYSNLWTNIISQTPTDVILQLSLTEGNQIPINPVPTPPSVPLGITVSQVSGQLPVWSIVGLITGQEFTVTLTSVGDTYYDAFKYTATETTDTRPFAIHNLSVGALMTISVDDRPKGGIATTTFTLV
jgi:hypothetical protein